MFCGHLLIIKSVPITFVSVNPIYIAGHTQRFSLTLKAYHVKRINCEMYSKFDEVS